MCKNDHKILCIQCSAVVVQRPKLYHLQFKVNDKYSSEAVKTKTELMLSIAITKEKKFEFNYFFYCGSTPYISIFQA